MLDPRNRRLLLESLRPPDGYHFDKAVGTSYSLDLLALLAAPLAFTFFDWEDEEGRTTADPFALLESVRRHANRVHLFCQAGEIKLPPPAQPLLAYLEQSVIAVRAPTEGGIFHPKVWAVRYLAEGRPVHYRLISLTRNLTFDRSWDTVLVLDGQLQDRTNAIRTQHPIGEFLESLPGLAVHAVPQSVIADIGQIAHEIRRVVFEYPPDVDSVRFWPLGIPGHKKSPLKAVDARDRMLVMAPFVSASAIKSMALRKKASILISRPDELRKLSPEALSGFPDVYFLNNAADDPEDDKEDGYRTSLSGLHAKLFVLEAGWDVHVFTGSANATDAAFGRNVEFVVELVGKKSKLGIDIILGEEGKKEGVRPLLERWVPGQVEISQEEVVRERLEKELADLRRSIAAHPMFLRCKKLPEAEAKYELELHTSRQLPESVQGRILCWPSNLRSDIGVVPARADGLLVTFAPISLESISGFLACELTASHGQVKCVSRFVLNLPLEGVPQDRLQRILAAQLTDKDKLLRLLMLLLSADGATAALSGAISSSEDESNGRAWSSGSALFERLVQAMVDSKRSVGEVGSLIDDLVRTEEGRRAVPPELLHLWAELKICIGGSREPA